MYRVEETIIHKFWGKGKITHTHLNFAKVNAAVTFTLLDKEGKKRFNKSRRRIPGHEGDMLHRCYENNLDLINYPGM